ncbi:unnamed protein product [Diamesa serratosioi]
MLLRIFKNVLLVCFLCPIATHQKSSNSIQSSSDDSVDGQEDCIVDYLKRNGFIDIDFIFQEFNGNRFSCDFKIEKKIEVFYEKVARDFNMDSDLKIHTECLIKNLKNYNMAEMTFEMKIHDSIRRMSKKGDLNSVQNYEDLLASKKEDAIILCKAEMKLYKVFNETMLTIDTKWELNLEEFEDMNICNETIRVDAMDEFRERYCTRMYVVENKLIEPDFYKVKIVEDCVYRFEGDCEQVLTERNDILVNDMLSSLIHPDEQLPRRRNCMKKRIQFGNYFDYFAVIKVLNDRDNIDEEIDQQRQNFISKMNAVLARVLNC